MKIAKLEAIPVRIPYKRIETSSLIARGGVADVLVKVTTEDGPRWLGRVHTHSAASPRRELGPGVRCCRRADQGDRQG